MFGWVQHEETPQGAVPAWISISPGASSTRYNCDPEAIAASSWRTRLTTGTAPASSVPASRRTPVLPMRHRVHVIDAVNHGDHSPISDIKLAPAVDLPRN